MSESTLVYDIETARPVRMPGEPEWPEIEYASSWESYEQMGIACVCVFDFKERRFRVFDKHTLAQFKVLIREREKIVGWNNHKFDDPLLAAHGVYVDPVCSVDLMELFPHRLKLEDAARANGIPLNKSMPGAMAPIKWQKGHYGAVIDYGISDTWATTMLYAKWKKEGYLIDPRTHKKCGLKQ